MVQQYFLGFPPSKPSPQVAQLSPLVAQLSPQVAQLSLQVAQLSPQVAQLSPTLCPFVHYFIGIGRTST